MNLGELMRRFKLLLASKGVYVCLGTPYGIDLKASIEQLWGDIHCIFDVGANIGQSTHRFKAWWPDAEVYCFEPISTTFQALVEHTKKLRNVHCYKVALGAKEGQERVWLKAKSVGNSLKKNINIPEKGIGKSEIVTVTTLDKFCLSNGIHRIDLLKLDVEGYEMEVLKGGHAMLASGRIQFIIAETTLAKDNALHVPIWEFVSFLEPLSFRLVGVYNQRFTDLDGRGAYVNYGDALFKLQL